MIKMTTRNEAVQKLATAGCLSIAHAEDLYDSFFPRPVVSQYVADWYEGNKDEFEENIWARLIDWDRRKNHPLFNEWFDQTDNPIQILVNMHQFGYTVEKEPRYKVRIKGVSEINRYLNKENGKEFLFSDSGETEDYQTKFTRKELEANGFDWVFDCPGVEVKEVE